MKLIPLTQGYHAMVDDEDFDRLNKFKWRIQKVKHLRYARRSITTNGNYIQLGTEK